jgi:DNA polymerase-3 subunit delta
MSNEKFHKELKKGLPDHFYFLWSKESLFLEEALTEAIEVVIGPHQKDFNFDVFYPLTSPQEILNVAFTVPFLAPRRLVVLKDFHEFPALHVETLTSFFKRPCDTTCMLIFSLKEPQLNVDVTQNIYYFRVRESDIPAWLKQKADKKGIKLSEDAVEYLIESVGPNIGLLSMEVEKLSLLGLKTIKDKDIISYTRRMRDYIPFDLVDALMEGQKAKAFRILNALFEGGSADPPVILGALNWHYRQLYGLWKNKGKKPSRMKMPTFRKLLQYLPSFSESSRTDTQENFCRIFQSLYEADLRIKTSVRPELALEILLIKLLQSRGLGTEN